MTSKTDFHLSNSPPSVNCVALGGASNTNAEKVKTVYSDEAISIMERAKIEQLLKDCHKLREINGRMNKHDNYVLLSALKMYKNYQERILRSRKRRGLTP